MGAQRPTEPPLIRRKPVADSPGKSQPFSKASSAVSRNCTRHILLSLSLALAIGPWARTAAARPRDAASHSASRVDPAPVMPIVGARVEEGSARFEVLSGTNARDVRVVIAHFPFDPTTWSSIPSGPAWTIVPYSAGPVPLGSLGVVDATDTQLWWAVVWTDARTGALRASQ